MATPILKGIICKSQHGHTAVAVHHVAELGTYLEIDVTRRDDLLGFQLALNRPGVAQGQGTVERYTR
jgi:hypothetical protein